MKKITVTIGIPAYNEEKNIRNLLGDVLNFQEKNIQIEQIIVCSDASSDNTDKITQEFKSKKIKLLRNSVRLGLAKTQMNIFQNSKTDYVVLLNADIRVKDVMFVERLINEGADLISCKNEELKPRTFFESALLSSMNIKHSVFEKFQNADNIYSCHGTARAFSKKLYTRIRIPSSVGEDAYSYLFCKFYGLSYKYSFKTKVNYRLPDNFSDHLKQSSRFFRSKSEFVTEFGQSFIDTQYSTPKLLLVRRTISEMVKNFPRLFYYVSIYIVTLLISVFQKKQDSQVWESVSSSKVVNL